MLQLAQKAFIKMPDQEIRRKLRPKCARVAWIGKQANVHQAFPSQLQKPQKIDRTSEEVDLKSFGEPIAVERLADGAKAELFRSSVYEAWTVPVRDRLNLGTFSNLNTEITQPVKHIEPITHQNCDWE